MKKILLILALLVLPITLFADWQYSSNSQCIDSDIGGLPTDLITSGGLLYMKVQNYSNNQMQQIYSYDGLTWTAIGLPLPQLQEWRSGLKVYNGTVYTTSTNIDTFETRAYYYNGSTWTVIGTDYTSVLTGSDPVITSDYIQVNGTEYLTVGLSNSSVVGVYKNVSGVWTDLDGTTFCANCWSCRFGTYNNELYISYANPGAKVGIKKWNGSSWDQVGIDAFSNSPTPNFGKGTEIEFAFTADGKIYSAVQESLPEIYINAYYYDGVTWTSLDLSSQGLEGGGRYVHSIFMADDNYPIVASSGTSGTGEKVYKYNGSSWSLLGDASSFAAYGAAAVKSGTNLYMSFWDGNCSNSGASMIEYDLSTPTVTPTITRTVTQTATQTVTPTITPTFIMFDIELLNTRETITSDVRAVIAIPRREITPGISYGGYQFQIYSDGIFQFITNYANAQIDAKTVTVVVICEVDSPTHTITAREWTKFKWYMSNPLEFLNP